MTYEIREALANNIVENQPALRNFVRNQTSDLMSGSWDLISYSFERGFEAMWDLARVDTSGLLDRPLLVLCRQSIELSIKATILATHDRIEGRPGHNLTALFNQLIKIRVSYGYIDDDDLTDNVRSMIAEIQLFDPIADRFRYPSKKDGEPYAGISLDYNELYQAHWIITTWCEGSEMQMNGEI